MTRAILLILAMLIPQSAGWVVAGCRAASGRDGSCCASGGCCGSGTCSCCTKAVESCCNEDATTSVDGRSCGPARCDPRCCLGLERGVPLVRLGDSGRTELRVTGHQELTGAPAWAGLVRAEPRYVALAEQAARPDPPPDDAPQRRARLCIWTI